MNRRDAIRQGGYWAAAAALGLALPVRTWAVLPAPAGSSTEDEALLSLIGDTLLPATPGSPGAAAVGIGRFIAMMVAECRPPAAGEALRRGLVEIQAASRQAFGREFAQLTVAERETVLVDYERQSADVGNQPGPKPWTLIKELTVLGYCTSEAGATQALRYDPVPGAYRGSVRLVPGERSWAL